MRSPPYRLRAMRPAQFTFEAAAGNIRRRETAHNRELRRKMGTVRRVITGHDKDGTAVVLMDGQINTVARTGGIGSAVLWITEESPADMSGDKDRVRAIGVPPPPNGSILRIVDFPPVKDLPKVSNEQMIKEMGISAKADGKGKHINNPFMHRTKSIDYAIVLEGEIDMLLDDSEVHMKAGDIMVQQGTNHAWVNNSDKNCRIAFVLIDAKTPPVLEGRGGGH
jgi:mannose-6-phosphate isomerase-like protein (cupin superfamily)